jgi:hypothetical protein
MNFRAWDSSIRTMMSNPKPYPSAVSDEDWPFLSPLIWRWFARMRLNASTTLETVW